MPNPQNHWAPYVWLHKLLTLPSLAPFLTQHTVPSILRCLIFTGLNVFWGWNRIRYTTDYQLYGWLTIANAGLALLLPTRTNLFAVVARIPSSILLMYHRWAGVTAVVHATLHFGLTAQHYVRTNQFDTVLENARIRVGIMAWAALTLMFMTSLRILRRRAFEVFYYAHFLFLVFVGGAFYHATYATEFILPGLILWAIDRLIRFCYNFRSIVLESVTHYAGDVTKLKFRGAKTASAGQIAWVQIPSISLANWHPFTIASGPREEVGTIAIRALGGYTKNVQQMAVDGDMVIHGDASAQQTVLAGQVKIRLDGPYGVGRIQWARYPVVVLVAGGIGITPGISIASYIIKNAASAGVGSNRRGWHLHLLWSLSDIAHVRWFGEELKNLSELASRPDVPVSFDISIHVTKAVVTNQEEHDIENIMKYEGPGRVREGRPNVMQWFQDIKTIRAGLDAAVNLCGPRSLVDDGRKAAARVSGRDGLFHVEEETFEF
ncbi:Superoxide-generating NADPH oxidase heavy chain subunit A [Madurella mycetomatis]|uniref:Superoxide-generating NADPH oxidase heavy chain subunit A n=1 Tax=Madurella mycetomatis TaxID=100816 RepID=A0A175VXL1_9PEZI|nr:Superoxide-generating NADPH oxidase heavy chain subunit A [Madurella mycetomatis]